MNTLPPAVNAWYGNAAKMRIIGQIAADSALRVIMDYGAGAGQGWATVLAHHPNLSLVCYEPDPARAAKLRDNVPAARIVEGDASAIDVQADVIVSFSVFEHVYDRRSYLANARRWLKPTGRFFLNYDDGHFREPSSHAEALRNRLAPFLPLLGQVGHFQARVQRGEADALIAAEGFAIAGVRYENLRSLKNLSKTIPAAQREAFADFWLGAEERLNAAFSAEGPLCLGDTVNLWREMGSRTLELVHAQAGDARR